MRAFFRDFLIAFAAVALPMVLAALVIGVVPWADQPVLAPVHIVYLVPLGILAFGLRHLRYGTVAGVVTFAAAAYGWIGGGLLWQITTLREMEMAVAAPPVAKGLLALPNAESCDALCVQVLVSRKFNVAIPSDGDWAIWNVVQGAACNSDALRPSRGQFLRAGYRDTCMQHHTVEEIGNALVLAEQVLPRAAAESPTAESPTESPTAESSPEDSTDVAGAVPGFAGTLLELRVRSKGTETVVARRFIGAVGSSVERMTFSIAPGPFQVGGEADRVAFYEAATGLDLQGEGEAPAEALAAMNRAELALMKSDLVNDVKSGDERLALASAFARASGKVAKDDLPTAREHTARLLASGSPVLTHAGLLALYQEPKRDVPFAREQLARLLQSDNPAIVGIAIRRAFNAFEMGQDPAIKPLILDVAFRTDLFQGPSMLAGRWGSGYPDYVRAYDTFDDAMRRRAKAFLLDEADVTTTQCMVLFRIVRTGGKVEYGEALDTFLALPRKSFIACADELGNMRSGMLPSKTPRLANPQMSTLLSRAKDLPILALADIWDGLQQSDDDRERAAPDFLDILAARRHDVDQDPSKFTDKEQGVLRRLEAELAKV